MYAVECVAGSIVSSSYYACFYCGCSIPLFCMFFGCQDEWKWQKKFYKNWQLTLIAMFFQTNSSLQFGFCVSGYCRQKKYEIKEWIGYFCLYIWVTELRSHAQPGVSLSFYFKLRSLKSYLCSAFLSITNLINKIANKNRIINTKFSRRTWQNNACQLLLFTQYMLSFPHFRMDCQGSSVWALWFVQQFSITTIWGFLLGQPLKRSVHILYRVYMFCSYALCWQFSPSFWRCPSSRNCVPFLFRVCAIVHCSVSSSGDEALKCSSSRSEVKLSNKTCLLQSIENFSYS